MILHHQRPDNSHQYVDAASVVCAPDSVPKVMLHGGEHVGFDLSAVGEHVFRLKMEGPDNGKTLEMWTVRVQPKAWKTAGAVRV